MAHQQVTLNPHKLLNAVNENLNRHFFADSRDSSKQLFKAISDGQEMPFMKIDMGEAGEVYCQLALDSSQHVGKLNYGGFRKALAMMMLGIKNRTEADESLNVMSGDSGDLMFNIPGIVKSDQATNIMVCGMRQIGPGLANINLMYLDPQAYAAAVKGADNNSTDTTA